MISAGRRQSIRLWLEHDRRSLHREKGPISPAVYLRGCRRSAGRHSEASHFLRWRPAVSLCKKHRRHAVALTMLDKKPVHSEKADWPPEIAAEFEREAESPN